MLVSNGAKPNANRYEADLTWAITDRASIVVGANYYKRNDFNALEGRVKVSWKL